MKVTDYILEYLISLKITTVFGITGSAVAPLFDSFRNYKKIKLVCVQHEQAAAFAADAYARATQGLGVAFTTSGPGATNLITGICCSWFDSIPGLYITGQVNSSFTKGNLPVRQVGFQETDIVSIIKPITKYAVIIKDPAMIRYELEKAVHISMSGRPGPVLIDLPMDIQRADIKINELKSYDKRATEKYESKDAVKEKILRFIADLVKAKRPVLLVGGGIQHARATLELRQLLDILKIPVVATWAAIDAIEYSHPLFRGLIGTYGQRGANFTIQNSDLLLSLGSRQDGRQTGGKVASFAREAKKYIVDIDARELSHQQVKGDVNIHADLKEFIPYLMNLMQKQNISKLNWWLKKTKEWQNKYKVVLPEYKKMKNKVNGYVFMDVLSELADNTDIIVGDCGANIVHLAQAYKVKKGQRIITAWAHSPMGYAFAASLGAYYGKKPKTKHIICTIGDGGMQVNIQELQTIKEYQIPIKIFILNNRSYGIIKQFQDIYHKSRYIASKPGLGYSIPNFLKVARAYGLKTESIKKYSELKRKIKKVLAIKGSVICNVSLPEKIVLIPRLGWNTGIEDQYPYLDRKEFLQNLYIKQLENKV
jgi:acetolactate synthase-1/2/3 large subunit